MKITVLEIAADGSQTLVEREVGEDYFPEAEIPSPEEDIPQE